MKKPHNMHIACSIVYPIEYHQYFMAKKPHVTTYGVPGRIASQCIRVWPGRIKLRNGNLVLSNLSRWWFRSCFWKTFGAFQQVDDKYLTPAVWYQSWVIQSSQSLRNLRSKETTFHHSHEIDRKFATVSLLFHSPENGVTLHCLHNPIHAAMLFLIIGLTRIWKRKPGLNHPILGGVPANFRAFSGTSTYNLIYINRQHPAAGGLASINPRIFHVLHIATWRPITKYYFLDFLLAFWTWWAWIGQNILSLHQQIAAASTIHLFKTPWRPYILLGEQWFP